MLYCGLFSSCKHRVERRRLSRTGRARHQNHSVRRIDRLPEFAERRLVHAHLLDASGQRRLIENTNDDFLAVAPSAESKYADRLLCR